MDAMAHSGSKRHRDRDRGLRTFEALEAPAVDRVFRITEDQRNQVAECLRFIDGARRVLEGQQNPDNREIVRELQASADRIYDLINDLEETDR